MTTAPSPSPSVLVPAPPRSARIGWFGDEALSQALLERVGVRAGTRAPEAIPDEPPSTPSGNPYFSRSAISDEVMLRDLADAPYHDRVVP